jgi:serine phosphatase RsbU (regulator of sigma subunit)
MPSRILVIDDNANDLRVMRHRLEREGFQVLSAVSGEAGLEMARSQPPDCIMVDFRMPGMDGREVCRRVRADEVMQNIPIIMVTGADQPEDIVEGINAGANDYVSKSAASQVVLARVKAQLRVKAYQDHIRSMNQKMANDLRIARKVQEALLPQPEFTSLGIDVRAAYIPSELLSGDFYDYVTANGFFYLLMADVSGHGLPAAILVSLLKTYLHTEANEGSSPAEFMGRLNDFLFSATLPSQFATAQLFRFEPKEKLLRVSNAAHPPFLLYRKETRKTESFEQPGHLLGAMPGMEYDENAIEIRPGDILFSYTDGLTDRRAPSGEFYALDRIGAILETSATVDFAALYQAIFEDVASFIPTEDFRDDVAFVLARFD